MTKTHTRRNPKPAIIAQYEKLEEKFGYKLSYKDAYEFFKANASNMNLPKEQEKELLAIFKEIVRYSEEGEGKKGKEKKN